MGARRRNENLARRSDDDFNGPVQGIGPRARPSAMGRTPWGGPGRQSQPGRALRPPRKTGTNCPSLASLRCRNSHAARAAERSILDSIPRRHWTPAGGSPRILMAAPQCWMHRRTSKLLAFEVIPAALEVSQSGRGAHVWLFFSAAVPGLPPVLLTS
jgi:hypothetical protein